MGEAVPSYRWIDRGGVSPSSCPVVCVVLVSSIILRCANSRARFLSKLSQLCFMLAVFNSRRGTGFNCAFSPFRRRVEESEELVVSFCVMGSAVVVAFAQARKCHQPGVVSTRPRRTSPRIPRVGAAFGGGHFVAVESGGNPLFAGRQEEIARQLFDGELVERHIVVERLDTQSRQCQRSR